MAARELTDARQVSRMDECIEHQIVLDHLLECRRQARLHRHRDTTCCGCGPGPTMKTATTLRSPPPPEARMKSFQLQPAKSLATQIASVQFRS